LQSISRKSTKQENKKMSLFALIRHTHTPDNSAVKGLPEGQPEGAQGKGVVAGNRDVSLTAFGWVQADLAAAAVVDYAKEHHLSNVIVLTPSLQRTKALANKIQAACGEKIPCEVQLVEDLTARDLGKLSGVEMEEAKRRIAAQTARYQFDPATGLCFYTPSQSVNSLYSANPAAAEGNQAGDRTLIQISTRYHGEEVSPDILSQDDPFGFEPADKFHARVTAAMDEVLAPALATPDSLIVLPYTTHSEKLITQRIGYIAETPELAKIQAGQGVMKVFEVPADFDPSNPNWTSFAYKGNDERASNANVLPHYSAQLAREAKALAL
jgi:broad specificity phosphatase PhoE